MKVQVYNNYCKVVEADRKEMSWLRNLLTVDVPGAKYSPVYRRKQWDGKKRFFNFVSKVFPIGFLNFVIKNKGDNKIIIEDTRIFDFIDDTNPELTIELRDYQKKAIQDCLQYKNCIIQAATNAGKTAIFSGVIKKLHQRKTLILIHREEILFQMKKMIEQYTGLEVGIITSKDVLIKPVTIAMVATLTNRLGVDQEITDFYEQTKCVIVDEVHHASSKTITNILSNINAVYRYGFSGTVPSEDTHAGMLVRCWIGSVIFQIRNEELIELGISAKPKIIIIENDVSDKLIGVFEEAKASFGNKEYNNQELLKKVYTFSVERGIVQNEDRNRMILTVVCEHPEKSILIIVDFLNHGENVQRILKEVGFTCAFISGEADIRESALKEFKEGKLKRLISTNIIDEGVDISRIEVLVLLSGKKSRRQILQRIGRSLRKKEGENSVLIYDFIDYGSRHLFKHSKERLKIYQDEGFDVEFRKC